MSRPYFDDIAEYYDSFWGAQDDESEELAFLRGHAGPGPVLEAGVGTGRLAIPLAEGGIRVHGVDDSPAMLAQLAVKAAERAVDDHLTWQRSDLSLAGVTGSYSLVAAVYHTLYYAHSRAEQAEFFRAARQLLDPGGVVVVEAYQATDKRIARWSHGVLPIAFDENGLQLEFYNHRPHERTVRTGRLVIEDGRSRYSYHVDRYLWPDEMDRLASDAGLELVERTAGWCGEPFDPKRSGRCVATYRAGDRE